MKLCFLLLIVACVACWFRGCDINFNLTVEVIPPDNVRPIPAFKHSPEPRVHLREPETL
jgi:hypothetical protein